MIRTRIGRELVVVISTLAAGIGSTAAVRADDRPANESSRGQAVERALSVVRKLGTDRRDALDRSVYEASRTRCHADTTVPATACLIDAATASCAGDADCLAAADVVVTNLRSATFFIDDVTRARLVRSSTDYHAALSGELRRRYAPLAAELAIEGHGVTGASIDRFCRQRDRVVHACAPNDAACVPSVPWSRCVAAIVWFVGGASP